ncbi:MAG: M23 family metallopeptidase [Clostridia bacterium]|nr:M23 family metallopeptidase [Clostridia bacterium]
MATSKGFYITLCTAIAIVGFSVYSRHLRTNMEQQIASFDDGAWREAVVESEVEVINVDESELQKSQTETSKPVNSFEKVPEVVETSAKAEPKVETPKFSMEIPCDGKLIASCSIDDLVYCETMEDWRTHNGIDIAGKVGDPVKAAEAGVISEVYKDDLLGVVVVVDHGNEMSSLYGNLQNVDFIKVGTTVQKGDIIGGIGENGALEANLEPHLHFEVMSNGEYKNPQELFNS